MGSAWMVLLPAIILLTDVAMTLDVNVDIFPHEPQAEICECKTDDLAECSPCKEPFVWDTVLNICVLGEMPICKNNKTIDIGGSAYIATELARKRRKSEPDVITSRCDKETKTCNLTLQVARYCNSSLEYPILTPLLNIANMKILVMILDEKRYVIEMEKPSATNFTEAHLPALLVSDSIEFHYESTTADGLHIELGGSICCVPKKKEGEEDMTTPANEVHVALPRDLDVKPTLPDVEPTLPDVEPNVKPEFKVPDVEPEVRPDVRPPYIPILERETFKLCPDGFMRVLSSNSCFKVIEPQSTPNSWSSSLRRCQAYSHNGVKGRLAFAKEGLLANDIVKSMLMDESDDDAADAEGDGGASWHQERELHRPLPMGRWGGGIRGWGV